MSLEARIRRLLFSFRDKPRKPGEVWVSEVAGGCMRRSWFEIRFNARPEPTGPMVLGKLLHAVLPLALSGDDEFASGEYEVECKYDLGGGWVLAGRADAVASGVVYEFKFTRGAAFNQAGMFYYAQVVAYLHMLGLDRGRLVLIDPGDFNVRILDVEPDGDVWNTIVEEARILVDHVERGVVPDFSSPRVDWQCKRCAWRAVCERIGGGREPVREG